MVRLTRITNILTDSRATWEAPAGRTLSAYVPHGFDSTTSLIEVDGLRVENLRLRPQDGADVVFVDLPGLGTIIAALPTIIISLAVSALTSYISYLLRPRPPRLSSPGTGPDDRWQFQGVQTTIGAGFEIPFILGGPLRVGGHVIESFNDIRFHTQSDSDEGVTTIAEGEKTDPDPQTLNTRILWSWGPIESITNLEIDDTAIENVHGVQYETVLGTLDQRVLKGFADSKTERQSSIGLPVTVSVSGGAVVKTTSDAVRSMHVRMLAPQGLFQVGSRNKLESRDVQCKIEYKETSAGSYTVYDSPTFSAATTKPIGFWVDFPRLAPGKYDVRITRLTPDNDPPDPTYVDTMQWDILTEVLTGGRAHPGLAQTGFRQIPQELTDTAPRGYTALAKGVNDIRIYTDTTSYTTAWTANPAWCFLHWLAHPLYGPGEFFTYEDSIENMQQFIDWAAHCDANSLTFGFEFKRRLPANQIREMFERAGDARLLDLGGKWRVVINEDNPPETGFGEGNYELDSCRWTFLTDSTRPTRLTGHFQNEDREYEYDSVSVDDANIGITDHFVDDDINFLGVNSRSQVEWLLRKIMNEIAIADEAVEFEIGYTAAPPDPGSIIRFSSPTGGEVVTTGRLYRVSADLLTLTIDKEVALNPANTYEITIIHSIDAAAISQKQLINITADATSQVEVAASTWTLEPKPGDLYSIGLVGFSSHLLRVERVIFNGETLKRKITATRYDPSIHVVTMSSDAAPAFQRLPNPAIVPGAVGALTLTQRSVQTSGGDSDEAIDVSWTAPSGDAIISHYDIWYRDSATTVWRYAGRAKFSSYTIVGELNTSITYDVAVLAVSAHGKRVSLDDATTGTIAL